MLVNRELTKLQKEFHNLRIKRVDILAHPGIALKAGVRMIPTLDAEGARLSGFLLSSAEIRNFVMRFVSAG